MKVQEYTVPVIPSDLRRDEAIITIADLLDHVQSVTDDVLYRIERRTADISERLAQINQRAALAQAKVDRLKGSNKATKVFSSAKFPGNESYTPHTATFVNVPANLSTPPRNDTIISSKYTPVDDKVRTEKLQFFNVQLRSLNQRHELESTGEEGMGSLPSNLTSVSSLLLFNTAENPYKKYVLLDPLGAASRTRRNQYERVDEDDSGIGQAPHSISQRDQLERRTAESYTYSPGLGHVPDLDVPLDLPDLPGIADDLSYTGDIGPTIAPSVPFASVAELPPIIPDLPTPDIINTVVPELPTIALSLPPPGPPLPPPPVVESTPPPTLPSPVPPPPPPPAVEIPEVSVKSPTTPSSDIGDARANLLDSIRKAGGKATKRTVQDRKIEAKKKKQEEKSGATTSGDLMSDLFNKLAMRRKGISGAAKTTDQSSTGQGFVGAMDKISSMIPPPPKPPSDKPTDDDDSDWS